MAASKAPCFISFMLGYTQQEVLQSPQCLNEIDGSGKKKSQVLKALKAR